MSQYISTLRTATGWLAITVGTVCLLAVCYIMTQTEDLAARLLPWQLSGSTPPWVTITAEEMIRGISVQAHTNNIIHFPENMPDIERRVLFGGKGAEVRYWGYCFPPNLVIASRKTTGLPGKVFLSEAERDARRERILQQRRDTLNTLSLREMTEELLNETNADPRGVIRHQFEYFEAGTSCYLMAEQPLPLGLDQDEDQANNYIERIYGSDPLNPDTDGDGIPDGLEIFGLKTNPVQRDSDGDGIIDGIEDTNQNGKVDDGETNPLMRDSDHDNLCDGLCLVNNGREFRGEDKNLNGIVDEDENDPRLPDTDGDGILDEQEYFNCQLSGKTDC